MRRVPALKEEEKNKMMIFTGSSVPGLGKKIADKLHLELGKVKLTRFSDGEIYVRYLESIRGAHVFLIQTCSHPVNYHIMETLIMVDALKRASAKNITAVIPYMGYSRQDRKVMGREPISAKLIADLLSVAGIDRMMTMDLHAGQIQGFFNVPVDHLTAVPKIIDYINSKNIENLVIVSPDAGRVGVARKVANKCHAELAILYKRRPKPNVSETINIVGDVRNKNVFMIDDLIDTGGTVCESAEFMKKLGANKIYTACTHPVFSKPVYKRLKESSIIEVVVTDTMPIKKELLKDKLVILSVVDSLSQAIKNVFYNKSVSEIFEGRM